MSRISVFALALIAALTLAAISIAQEAPSTYVPVRVYDPARNAEQDVANALKEAQRTGKNVMVEVGGKWCIWCRTMDGFFQQHPALNQLREKNYVVVFVNFSPENKNQAFLGRYPKISGYPHYFVLRSDGKLLRSQNTGDLEDGRSYNARAMENFLKKWAPKSVPANNADRN